MVNNHEIYVRDSQDFGAADNGVPFMAYLHHESGLWAVGFEVVEWHDGRPVWQFGEEVEPCNR